MKIQSCSETGAYIQSNRNGSNTDGSFTMANSNSFLNPYEILPIAHNTQILREIFLFYHEIYVLCTHKNRLIEAILMSTINVQLICRKSKKIPNLSQFAS